MTFKEFRNTGLPQLIDGGKGEVKKSKRELYRVVCILFGMYWACMCVLVDPGEVKVLICNCNKMAE